MNTHAREAILRKCFFLLCQKGSTLKGKTLLPGNKIMEENPPGVFFHFNAEFSLEVYITVSFHYKHLLCALLRGDYSNQTAQHQEYGIWVLLSISSCSLSCKAWIIPGVNFLSYPILCANSSARTPWKMKQDFLYTTTPAQHYRRDLKHNLLLTTVLYPKKYVQMTWKINHLLDLQCFSHSLQIYSKTCTWIW